MVYKSLKINTKSNHNWNDMVFIFDIDVKLIKIIKRDICLNLKIKLIL